MARGGHLTEQQSHPSLIPGPGLGWVTAPTVRLGSVRLREAKAVSRAHGAREKVESLGSGARPPRFASLLCSFSACDLGQPRDPPLRLCFLICKMGGLCCLPLGFVHVGSS